MKPVVMHLVTSLNMGGAERLCLSIIDKNKNNFDGIIASLYGTEGDLARCAESMNITSFGLNASGGRIKTIYTLYKALLKHDVSLLHVQAGYLLLFAFFAAKLAGVKLVYTEHALNSIKKYSNIRRGIRFFAPYMQGISCVNEEIKEYFITKLHIPADKVKIIENGVDSSLFSALGDKAELPWHNESEENEKYFVFGTVGRLTEAKDHPNLIKAFSLLEKKYPQLRLLIVGDGEERKTTKELISSLKLEDKVHMAGNALDIPERLRSMDTFVLSSQREGLPVAILEAMSCKIAVISTDVGGISALNDKSSAKRIMLVPPKNPEALASAMEDLFLNKEKRQELAQNGLSYILAERSDTIMAKQYYNLYNAGGLEC